MGKAHIVYIVIIVILLGIIGLEYQQSHKAMTATKSASNASMDRDGDNDDKSQAMKMQNSPSGKPKGGMPGMGPVTPPVESDQQKAQLTAGTDSSSTEKTFNITGGNFYFVPKQITVNKGDKVTFIMTNGGGFHDLVIKELNVKTPVVQGGTAATATFTADKAGTYTYFCDVPGHKEKGMWGTLTVK